MAFASSLMSCRLYVLQPRDHETAISLCRDWGKGNIRVDPLNKINAGKFKLNCVTFGHNFNLVSRESFNFSFVAHYDDWVTEKYRFKK